MSLINDALKKAQKQRTGDAPSLGSMPSVGGQSASSISRSGKSSGHPLLVPAGIGAGVLVLAIAIGGWFTFRGKPETGSGGPASLRAASAPETATPVEKTGPQGRGPSSDTAAASQASGLRSQVSEPAASPASPAFTLQVAPAPATVAGVADPGLPAIGQTTAGPASPRPATSVQPTASNPQVSGFLPGGRPGQTPGSRQGTTVPPEPAKPVLKLEPRAMTFIDNIKIAGVRASATDSKVLMNDRVYRLGDTVDHEMGLKLVGITNNSLTFEDEKGGRYTRNL